MEFLPTKCSYYSAEWMLNNKLVPLVYGLSELLIEGPAVKSLRVGLTWTRPLINETCSLVWTTAKNNIKQENPKDTQNVANCMKSRFRREFPILDK